MAKTSIRRGGFFAIFLIWLMAALLEPKRNKFRKVLRVSGFGVHVTHEASIAGRVRLMPKVGEAETL